MICNFGVGRRHHGLGDKVIATVLVQCLREGRVQVVAISGVVHQKAARPSSPRHRRGTHRNSYHCCRPLLSPSPGKRRIRTNTPLSTERVPLYHAEWYEATKKVLDSICPQMQNACCWRDARISHHGLHAKNLLSYGKFVVRNIIDSGCSNATG